MGAPVEPISVFKKLYDQVRETGIAEPSAMTLATASREGRPSARIVLLKGVDERGFTFFTNLASRKSKELTENPFAALCFYWETIDYQVRVEGKVKPVSDVAADAYFASRPRGSQIGAWASHQSSKLTSRSELEDRVAAMRERFAENEVPRPGFWSGFTLQPNVIEFWRRRENRLHERTLYKRNGDSWNVQLLYP